MAWFVKIKWQGSAGAARSLLHTPQPAAPLAIRHTPPGSSSNSTPVKAGAQTTFPCSLQQDSSRRRQGRVARALARTGALQEGIRGSCQAMLMNFDEPDQINSCPSLVTITWRPVTFFSLPHLFQVKHQSSMF